MGIHGAPSLFRGHTQATFVLRAPILQCSGCSRPHGGHQRVVAAGPLWHISADLQLQFPGPRGIRLGTRGGKAESEAFKNTDNDETVAANCSETIAIRDTTMQYCTQLCKYFTSF